MSSHLNIGHDIIHLIFPKCLRYFALPVRYVSCQEYEGTPGHFVGYGCQRHQRVDHQVEPSPGAQLPNRLVNDRIFFIRSLGHLQFLNYFTFYLQLLYI